MTEKGHNEDALLISQIQSGNNQAFEKLFQKYHKRLYYFAFRYMSNKEDAEGLVQDVFIKIWENRHKLDTSLSFSSYLFTIGKNTIFNQNRKKVNEQAYLDYIKFFLKNSYYKTENEIIYQDLLKLIEEQVEKLPPQRKRIYLMSRNKGMSYKEIAAELNISAKTIESHIRLALQSIKKTIDNEFTIFLFLLSLTNF